MWNVTRALLSRNTGLAGWMTLDWFLQLIDSGQILAVPMRDDFGLEGEKEYVIAGHARLKAITAISSVGKAKERLCFAEGRERGQPHGL